VYLYLYIYTYIHTHIYTYILQKHMYISSAADPRHPPESSLTPYRDASRRSRKESQASARRYTLHLSSETNVEPHWNVGLDSTRGSSPPNGRWRLHGFLPQPDELYFTIDEKKILENCRCIVPNFMND
jgi:hypothetical protein